jgi:hypothetical protein
MRLSQIYVIYDLESFRLRLLRVFLILLQPLVFLQFFISFVAMCFDWPSWIGGFFVFASAFNSAWIGDLFGCAQEYLVLQGLGFFSILIFLFVS